MMKFPLKPFWLGPRLVSLRHEKAGAVSMRREATVRQSGSHQMMHQIWPPGGNQLRRYSGPPARRRHVAGLTARETHALRKQRLCAIDAQKAEARDRRTL